jgi:hypothetical protein
LEKALESNRESFIRTHKHDIVKKSLNSPGQLLQPKNTIDMTDFQDDMDEDFTIMQHSINLRSSVTSNF